MKRNAVKLTVVLLAGILLLGTAGAVSAGVGNYSINLTTGEITNEGATYTGYVEFTPDNTFYLNSFRVVIVPNDTDVRLGNSDKTDGLFADHDKFSYIKMRASTVNGTPAYTYTANLVSAQGVYNVPLTAGETYKILPFTIYVNYSTITNETVNLTFDADSLSCYVGSMDRSDNSSHVYKLNSELGGITYPLANATPNSIKPESIVNVDIETNGTIFDGNVTVFSELTKKIANSSAGVYYLNYTSSNEDVIKFYNYSNMTWNMTPRYVVLKGSNASTITVNLTYNGTVIDSKQFTANTKKIDVNKSMFNFTEGHTYNYSAGKSVSDDVLKDVKAALLNHSIGAASDGDDAQMYGYPRDVGEITLTFFNDTGVKIDPIEAGAYTFNISIAANDNYNAVKDLQIDNNTITINGGIIRGVCYPLNNSQFNATTPAKMTVEFNATKLNLSVVYYAESTYVEPYQYFFGHSYLRYNVSAGNLSALNGTAYNVSSDNKFINFSNASVNPFYEVTYFVFEGFPRGDVSLDGAVRANDAAMLAAEYANPDDGFLTQEQKFYANVKGSERLSLNDVRLIAQYSAGYVNADYGEDKS